jgi:hypothetical protein
VYRTPHHGAPDGARAAIAAASSSELSAPGGLDNTSGVPVGRAVGSAIFARNSGDIFRPGSRR